MGFPIGYSEFLFPKLILQILSLLSFIRKLISTFFQYFGLQHFIEPDSSISYNPNRVHELNPVHSLFIREILPVLRFGELVGPPETCAVCLTDFEENDEIRQLSKCTHVFHRCCLDRWIGYDQKTCPLCRTPFISHDFQFHSFATSSSVAVL